MHLRVVAVVLLFVLGVLAWQIWPGAAEIAPRTNTQLAPSATAPDAQLASADVAAPELPAKLAPAVRTEVTSTATFLVQGRAVSGVDKPLANAAIRARAFLGTSAKGEPFLDAHLTADAGGHFVWPLSPPTDLTFLELKGEGERIRSSSETFVLAAGDPAPPAFDLWIVPLTAVVRGRVLDPDHRPIVGARVGSAALEGATTDAEGRFEVAVERRPSVRLYAAARGFVELRHDCAIDVENGKGEAELHLRLANRIRGRVTDGDQRPVQGAAVRTFYTIYTDAAETDGDGRFVLDNLDPSLKSHSLFARKEGYVEGKAEVVATGPDVEQDLVLLRGVEVRGIVTGSRGQPLAAATVFLGSSPNAYNRLDAVSGNDGRFRFPCVAAGEEAINVERGGYAGKRLKVQVPKAPSAAVEVLVQLEAGHFIAGLAKGADGKPVEGVSIAARLDGEYLDGIRSKTDAEGHFRLDGLPARGLSLEFYGHGVLRQVVPVTDVDREDLAVTLERHGRMAGTVVDGRTGQPIPEFRIRFGRARVLPGETASGSYGDRAFHDEKGVFRIDEEVKVGAVSALEASAAGYGPTVDDHVVAALDCDPSQTVIALWPGVTIEGVVRERGTALPIAGAQLKAYSSGRPLQPYEPRDDEGRPMAVTDARGAFRLENVGPGEISMAVKHQDWLPTTHGPIHVEAGAIIAPQVIELGKGITVTVAMRSADGGPMAGAKVSLSGNGSGQASASSDAEGNARFERVAPGKFELVFVGPPPAGIFRRRLLVENADLTVDFVAKDGDATLVVILDSAEPLPKDASITILSTFGSPAKDGPVPLRSATSQSARTVIPLLPAADLTVSVFAPGWMGNANVTTITGQTVEVQVTMRKFDMRGR